MESEAGEAVNAPKRIDIAEFRRLGYLQEANRLFFHPLGLALEVIIHENGLEELGGVWDYRDDPEGITYDEVPDHEKAARREKAARVAEQLARVSKQRLTKLGWLVQPLGDECQDHPAGEPRELAPDETEEEQLGWS